MTKREKLSKKDARILMDVADKIRDNTQIDDWDGEKVRVWKEGGNIINLSPKGDSQIKAKITTEFVISTMNQKKADKMFDLAEEIFEGSDCEVHGDFTEDKYDSQDIRIYCSGENEFDVDMLDDPTNPDYKQEVKGVARRIDDFFEDIRNENRDYVRQVRDVDRSARSDIED